MNVRAALAVTAVALASVFLLTRPSTPSPTTTPQATAKAPRARRLAAPGVIAADDSIERSRRTTWRVHYTVDSRINGEAGPTVRMTGLWTTEGLSDDRVAAQLSQVQIEGHHMAPEAAEAERRLELLVIDGTIEDIGFAPNTSPAARRLLSTMATAVWPVVRDGERWRVEQTDIAGVHTARYVRSSVDIVERRIEAITALRGPDGLETQGADAVRPEGVSVFEFDAHGLKTARIVDDRVFNLEAQQLTVTAQVRARMERVDTRLVSRRAPAPFPMRGFQTEIDYARQSAMRDDQKVADADLTELLGTLGDALAMDPAHPDTRKWRHKALERLTALVRIDPTAAARMGTLLSEIAGDDPRMPFLTGALGSANTVDGTNALASALGAELPRATRRNVHANLSLTEMPTTQAIEALQHDLDGESADSAAMALGAQAGKLDPESEPVESALETLMRRYQEATTAAEKIGALKALGNSGHPMILGAVTDALADPHPAVASTAVRALRFVPGAEADALLAAQLTRGAFPREVIEAIGYRDAAVWAPRLSDARQALADDSELGALIDRLLAQWG